jgi:hypothetical protein
VGEPVRDRVKSWIDAIWNCPLSKGEISDLFEAWPRPSNLETLHKTRINPELLKSVKLPTKSRLRDTEFESVQWCLQFAARPLVQVLEDLDAGKEINKRVLAERMAASLKCIARPSAKLNNMRRLGLRPFTQGPSAAATENDGSQGFRYLLGEDFLGKIAASKELAKTFQHFPERSGNFPPGGRSRGPKRPTPSPRGDYRPPYAGPPQPRQPFPQGPQHRPQGQATYRPQAQAYGRGRGKPRRR